LGCSGKNDLSTNDLAIALPPPPPPIINSEQSSDKSEKIHYQVAPEITSTNALSPQPEQANTQKKIIHTADIRFKVEDLKKAETAIKARVKAMGGYISVENQNRQSGNLENTWYVRIPAEKFDVFLGDVEKESIYVDSKNVAAEDVTAEYVDNELRIKSKQKVFERYLELLKQAKNVQEIMAVEEQKKDDKSI
jgi:Domain of unknown function (DUF4349)